MVDGIGGAARPGAARAVVRPAGNGRFRLPEAAGAAGTENAAPVAAPGMPGLGVLRDERDPADEGAARRGAALLDELQAMQADLLRGRIDEARLARLDALAEGPSARDPALRETVQGIALRARIMLLRAGRGRP